jgi:hypothetical protein
MKLNFISGLMIGAIISYWVGYYRGGLFTIGVIEQMIKVPTLTTTNKIIAIEYK